MRHSEVRSYQGAGAPSGGGGQRRWWLWWSVVFVASVLVAGPWALRSLGHWLVVADQLGPADAIYVHSGHIPFRAMEAAQLVDAGFAREVWLSPAKRSLAAETLEALGLPRRPGWAVNREVLQRLGVAAEQVRVLPMAVVNTRDEVRAVFREMERRDLDRVILVTSRFHSRRVRALWKRYSEGRRGVLIRASSHEPFDPEAWWRDMNQARAVANEVVALIDLWLGEPLSRLAARRRQP